MRFINAVQPDVKDSNGMPRPTRALRGEPAICLGGFELIRTTDGVRAYSPEALAEHLVRLRDWPHAIQIDAEWDAKDPQLWQTSVTHPRTDPETLARTMRTAIDLSVVYTAMRGGMADFWYLIGCSPYFRMLNLATMRPLHARDQAYFRAVGIDAECAGINLDAYRTGAEWEDRWQPAVIDAMVRHNRAIWPTHPITISLACATTDGKMALRTGQLKADLDACRKALVADGHPANAIELWEGNTSFALRPEFTDLWNAYVGEHTPTRDTPSGLVAPTEGAA